LAVLEIWLSSRVQSVQKAMGVFPSLFPSPSAMLDFQIFKFMVATHVEKTNVHCHTNFAKISQTVLEISQFFDFQDDRRPPSWI